MNSVLMYTLVKSNSGTGNIAVWAGNPPVLFKDF